MSIEKKRFLYIISALLFIVGLICFLKAWYLVGEYTKHALNYKTKTHSVDFQVKDKIVYINLKEYFEIKNMLFSVLEICCYSF